MKTLCSLLCVLGLSVMIISCQTGVMDDLPTPPTPPAPGTSDSTYLSEWIVLDTTYPSGRDTSDIYRFSYDVNKRLSKLWYESYNLGVSGAARLYLHNESTYTYNGTDTVPSRLIDVYYYTDIPTRIIRDTTYYFYKNGMIRKDSLLVPYMGDEYLATEYTYYGGDRYHVRSMNYASNFMYRDDSGYSHVNWQNDLLLFSQDSIKRELQPWTTHSLQLFYDNKPNPFRKLLIKYPTLFTGFTQYSGWMNDWGFLPTRNNIIRYEEPGQPANALIYTYEYRSNGYPSVCRLDDGNGFHAKMIFKYTKL